MSLGLRAASPSVATRLLERIAGSSFRRRLALLSAAAVAAAVVLASVVTFLIVRNELRGEVDQSLQDTVGRIAVPAELLLPGTVPPSAENVLVLPSGPLGSRDVYAQVVRPDGSIVHPRGSRIRLPADQRVIEVAVGERKPFFTDTTIGGVHARVYTASLPTGDAVQAARPLEEVDRTLRDLTFALVLVGLGGVALAVWLGLAGRARRADAGEAAHRRGRARGPHARPLAAHPRRPHR